MAQYKIEIQQTFSAPVEDIFSILSDHVQFGQLLGVPIKVVKPGKDSQNGVGSIRQVHFGPLPVVEETVTQLIPNQLIEYTISQYSPIRNHLGRLVFNQQDGKTHLHYTILMESVIPFTTKLIAKLLKTGISHSLKRLALEKKDKQ